ncbi:MAG: bifunctional aspartate kinase/homoserine dehydrogenase I [Ignavibacteria bacterium]|nr:bifunctional aspartate kinase/homoserine dehydrogenase I [Ignavibacteria bacterium]
MKVLKFGGSSVSDARRIQDVAQIILASRKRDKVIVVVSAFQGITNQLLSAARRAESGDPAYQSLYREIMDRHTSITKSLLTGRPRGTTLKRIDALLRDLNDVLHGIFLLRYASPRVLDLTASFGEQLSATIISSFIAHSHPALYVDARSFIVTDDQYMRAGILFDATNKKTQKYFKELMKSGGSRAIPVVTGFIGATEDGRTTTIGRSGSDFTATIIGAALNASVIEIWTDVDGILSADPRAVPSAFVLPHVTYEEAMELSYFGARVLHSSTITPAAGHQIPILIKNTLNPGAPGTLVSSRKELWEGVAKGITSIDDIILFTLRKTSNVGAASAADRLFTALASANVHVILISQASSEHTICLAITKSDAERARRAIQKEFELELQARLLALDEKQDQAIVAIVGDGMIGTPGVSGKVFQALGRNNINISAIAQGASERNISFVVGSAQKVRALNVIHQAFFEKRKRLDLAVIGVGNIGGALLRQLHQQRNVLLDQGFDVRVCCLANSTKYVIDADGISLSHWREALSRSDRVMNPQKLAGELGKLEFANLAVVDCTASSEIVNTYFDFVRANAHIVTPNKKANVLPWKQYNELTDLIRARQKFFLYEANVGAGLPVISTLRDLVASGDTIVRIDAILSGTLSYLFNHYDGTQPFSSLVLKAHELGFTEPDPREDLSGQDVARKLLILGRQLGLKMDLKDIRAQNLVPARLRSGPFSPLFYAAYASHDSTMKRKLDHARAAGAVLRYVGTLHGKSASAGIKEISANHPFFATKGSDNILAFTTHRYSHTPLVVQGPGAGADVTAMGVFSDLLKLLNYLPY